MLSGRAWGGFASIAGVALLSRISCISLVTRSSGVTCVPPVTSLACIPRLPLYSLLSGLPFRAIFVRVAQAVPALPELPVLLAVALSGNRHIAT
jgi:hypothetical protein